MVVIGMAWRKVITLSGDFSIMLYSLVMAYFYNLWLKSNSLLLLFKP
jgi:hypothetical protein